MMFPARNEVNETVSSRYEQKINEITKFILRSTKSFAVDIYEDIVVKSMRFSFIKEEISLMVAKILTDQCGLDEMFQTPEDIIHLLREHPDFKTFAIQILLRITTPEEIVQFLKDGVVWEDTNALDERPDLKALIAHTLESARRGSTQAADVIKFHTEISESFLIEQRKLLSKIEEFLPFHFEATLENVEEQIFSNRNITHMAQDSVERLIDIEDVFRYIDEIKKHELPYKQSIER